MQEILAAYLFQYKVCPLPAIGSLQMVHHHAVVSSADKKVYAPQEVIELIKKEVDANPLVNYISDNLAISIAEASAQLSIYCDKLAALGELEEMALSEAGSFLVNEQGELTFVPLAANHSFTPAVVAEKVIRVNDTHAILVGDTETTNTEMNEYYTEQPVNRDRWWIWAIILFLIAAVIGVIYFNDVFQNNDFGNAQSATPKTETHTYKTGN